MHPLLDRIVTTLFRLRGGAIELSTARYQKQVAEITRRGEELTSQTDDQLRGRAASIRGQIRAGTPLSKVVIDAFALVRESARRTVGLSPYDVQILAGLALNEGKLIEMQTGEGKTLAAVFPASLQAFLGQGVHVLTYNDYLATRDAEWMGPLYRFLGLTVGRVTQGMTPEQRRTAYACDVTYATAKEAGFDFLRDQLRIEPVEKVHRGFHFAIVDEADSILIDEARVPLVIAGPDEHDGEDLTRFAQIVRSLRRGTDFSSDERQRNVQFTPEGIDRIQRQLACGELHTEQNLHLLTRLNVALQAQVLLQRDIDYLVRDGEIVLLDELTGRAAENRRWPHGLQGALEAKEGLAVQPQGKVLYSMTLQHFLAQYSGLSGMTGTAQDAAEELYEFYGTRVVVVPTHQMCRRVDQPDRIFRTRQAKTQALVGEITAASQAGRPVLVGTASIVESEQLASLLRHSGVNCQVLNARSPHREAAIVAEAGAPGAVTISTNMAGRGTDIRLGGSVERERERERVVALGGLLVLGTNRHESRRIDNQLRGRSGRQGDPGETRFYVSLEDDLFVRHGIGSLVDTSVADSADGSLGDPRVAENIAHVQRVIEGESFEIRRTLRKYSFCLEGHRRAMAERRRALQDGSAVPTLLRERDPELYERLVAEFGEVVVRNVERQVTLCQMDRFWSDHLEHASEIREGIHLFSLGGMNAFDGFNAQINAAYREFVRRTEEGVLSHLRKARITGNGIDLAREGLLGPSSTWTYMINDNPMGDILDRLTGGIRRLIAGRKRPGGSGQGTARRDSN